MTRLAAVAWLTVALAGLSPQVVSAETLMISNARVHTLAPGQPVLENGTIVIRDGLIQAVGQGIEAPPDAREIDAQGREVTAGLISAATQLGLTEHSANSHSSDQQVQGATLGAGFDVQYAINANSLLIAQARADGVTRAVSLPSDSGISPFNGLGVLLHLLEGPGVLEQPRFVLFAHLGGPNSAAAGGSRAAQWIQLRAALDQARYWEAPKASDRKALSLADLNSQALHSVVSGALPLLLDVRRESDIRQAIALRNEFDLRLIILGGTEAWRVADLLAGSDIPVIIDPAANLPQTFDELAARDDAARILQSAGVLMAFYASSGLHHSFNAGPAAREAAGYAVANGLPWEAGLAAITANVARIWGIEDRAGRIAPGQAADLVIWDGDPLEPSSGPVTVLVGGNEVSLETLQTRLRDKYLEPGSNPP